MVCCRCNRTGRCLNCSCVKNDKPCQGCLPQRLGACVNTRLSPSPTVTASSPSLHSQSRASALTPSSASPSQETQQDFPSAPTSFPSAPTIESSGQDLVTAPESEEPPLTLPGFQPILDAIFDWGAVDSATFIPSLNAAYKEVVHWKPNLFKVSYGKNGKRFVTELARLYKSFASGSAMESIALKAAVLFPTLVLQKPSAKSKVKEHNVCLERRLNVRLDGDLQDLAQEGRAIQQRIPKPNHDTKRKQSTSLARSFSKQMIEGNTRAAIRLLSQDSNGGMLHLNDPVDTNQTVKDVLIDKHPPSQPEAIIDTDPPETHPVLYEQIDASLIRSIALRTTGAAGPSSMDALCLRKICISFKTASDDLCQSLALSARRLCTSLLDPSVIAPLLACRLIALNKNPGVHPIGIGQTSRQIIAKAILKVTRDDIQEVTGTIQLCAGQISGTEAAVHSVRELYQQEDMEAILFVDARNALILLTVSLLSTTSFDSVPRWPQC